MVALEKVIVAAVAENGVIGRQGTIPWDYPVDRKHFRELTTGHPVVMGRETYRSLPEEYRPLPGRTNIVLSRSGMDVEEGVKVADGLEGAWEIAEETGSEQVFIIGGASIYEQTLPEADRMVITEVHENYGGGTYFPDWNREEWREVGRDDRGDVSFVEYERL